MPKYIIKQVCVSEPEIEMPEGSQVVNITYSSSIEDDGISLPAYWQVAWLEPDISEETLRIIPR